jgi:hypothetical protein
MAGLDTEGPARMNGLRRRPTSRLQVICEVIRKAGYCDINPDLTAIRVGGAQAEPE